MEFYTLTLPTAKAGGFTTYWIKFSVTQSKKKVFYHHLK